VLYLEPYSGSKWEPRVMAFRIHLTKEEQMVLCIVMMLLLTGWAVKAYRTANTAQNNPVPAVTR